MFAFQFSVLKRSAKKKYWYSGKETVLGIAFNKEGHTDRFMGAWKETAVLVFLKNIEL